MISEPLSEEEDRKLIVDRYSKGREKILDEIDEWEDPKFELYHVTDRYGFIHKDRLPDRLTQFENKIRQVEASRSSKWLKMLDNWKDHFDDKKRPKEKLRERVFKGIPNQVRGKAWCFLMGVPRVKTEQEGRYQEMLEWGLLHSRDVRQIDLDVNRTFRNNVMFKDRYDIKQQELFRILVAYSVYNSEIGYCQGMSQIAALLLMYLHDEEDAFWGLDRLMTDDRYAMHGFFIPGFPKLTRFAKHHDLVLKKYLPKVYKHFRKFDIDSTLYTLKWFFQCFLDRVPFSLTLRLWDVFMLEGEVVLTCMSYTLLKLHKRTVIRRGMEELIEFLQVDLEKDFGYHDDEAMTALQQSMLELKKHKMELPKDPPPDSEKPSRPFGFLLHADNISMSTTFEGSVAGSIVLRPDGMSLPSRRSSSLSDIEERVNSQLEELAEEELKFIDSSTISKALTLEDFTEDEGKVSDAQTTSHGNQDNLVLEATKATSSDEKHVFFQEQQSNHEANQSESNGKVHPLAESPVGSPNNNVTRSVLVALRSSVTDNSQSMEDRPESRRSSDDVKSEGDMISPQSPVTVDERSKSVSPSRTQVKGQTITVKTTVMRTSIPKVISPQKTSAVSPTHSSHHYYKQSFIPRIVKSPTHSSQSGRQDVTTISVGLGRNSTPSSDQDKVRIFVPYHRTEKPVSTDSSMKTVQDRNGLPAVDT